LVAAQAIDLRKSEKLGKLAIELHPKIREQIPVLENDRSLGPDIEEGAQILKRFCQSQ